MTEAVAPVMDYTFESLDFETLVFTNAVGNIGSLRFKEKTGAQFIGAEAASFVDPALRADETWCLSKADWLRARGNYRSTKFADLNFSERSTGASPGPKIWLEVDCPHLPPGLP